MDSAVIEEYAEYDEVFDELGESTMLSQAIHADLAPKDGNPINIDASAVTRILKSGREGSQEGNYLIIRVDNQCTKNINYYVFVVTASGNVIRCPIQLNTTNARYSIAKNKRNFEKINKLLEYYSSHPICYLGKNGQPKVVKLNRPIPCPSKTDATSC